MENSGEIEQESIESNKETKKRNLEEEKNEKDEEKNEKDEGIEKNEEEKEELKESQEKQNKEDLEPKKKKRKKDKEKKIKKKKKHVDSEEESEEEGEEDHYVIDGKFVVDDAESEEEGGGEEEEEEKPKKKRRPEEEELDEEDLEVIFENTGVKVSPLDNIIDETEMPKNQSFKRLKKGKTVSEEDKILEEIEPDEGPELGEEDFNEEDEDDWIVDVDKYGNEVKKPRRGLSMAQLSEASDIFGDMTYDEDEYEEELEEEMASTKLEEHYDYEELKSKYLSPEDEVIRQKDIPEHFQLRIPNRPEPEEGEIREEAEWIYTSAFASDERLPFRTVVPKIIHILEFIRVNQLEIPFIFTYKKDYYLPELSPSDLWEVYDWDEKWHFFYNKKKELRKLYASANMSPEFISLLDASNGEIELQDLYDHFYLHFGEQITENDSESKKKKPASKKDIYKLCKRSGILNFTKHFGISSQQFGENIMAAERKHIPTDPEKTPEEMAVEYICPEFNNSEAVLKAARYALAQEIAVDPSVRQSLRITYESKVEISTTPTLKGKKDIDVFHPYKIVSRIERKPADKFLNDQFLLILKAEKEGFITKSFEVDTQELLHEMEGLYLSENEDPTSSAWNEQRRMILQEVLEKFLIPSLEKELSRKLSEEASEVVSKECSTALHERVMAGPFEPPVETSSNEVLRDVKVMGVCWGTSNSSTMIAVINPDGEYVAHVKMNFLEKEKLKEFILEHKPNVIGIGAQLEARKLYDEISEVTRSIHKFKIHVAFVNMDVARIYHASSTSQSEFPEFPPTLRMAIGLARYLQDPMVQIGLLCNNSNEILALKFHPLQNMVDEETLLKHLHRTIINIVNSVGVDVHRIIKLRGGEVLLRYVSGLGPRKALHLVNKIFRRGGIIRARKELNSIFPGKYVYMNCAGFIKITKKKIMSASDEDWDPLDVTRIHPDDYSIVKKIAEDALDKQGETIDLVEELMRKPKKLEEMDIESLAVVLEKKNGVKVRIKMQDIKAEINRPFFDPRLPYRDPNPSELFEMWTGEKIESFVVGHPVNAKVVSILDKSIRCRLENDYSATIKLADISDNRVSKASEVAIEVGQTLICRIKQIETDQETGNKNIFLTCKSSDLRDTHWEEDYFQRLCMKEPYLRSEDSIEQKPKKNRKQSKKKPFGRHIDHPLFQNLNYFDSEKELGKKRSRRSPHSTKQ